MSDTTAKWKGNEAIILDTFDATMLLNAPFTVILRKSAKQVVDSNGRVIETIIPDPEGLVKAVAQARVLHKHKLSGGELKFLRSALGLKSKELARAIAVTPEHMSRLEAGEKVLCPQSEMLVRIFTFVSTVQFTKRKMGEAATLVANVFSKLSISPCHIIDEKISLYFERVTRTSSAGDPGDSDGEGLWEEPSNSIAA